MEAIGLTRSSIVLPILAFLQRAGAPVDRLLAGAGLPAWVLTDPETLIPTSGPARLLAEASRAEGIENLGLRTGSEARVDALGIYGRLIRRRPTLGGALEALVRHHPTFSSGGRMWLVSRGEQVELCHAFTNKPTEADEGWQQASHYVLMLMLEVIRLGAGATWRPSEVQLPTGDSAALRDAEPLSGAHVAFAQPATAVTLPCALLEQPLRRLPDVSLGVEDVEAWRASAPSPDFLGSMLQVIEMLSWERHPDIRLTADVIGMSVRTLQRQLAAAGFTHTSLVDRVRFGTAAALLEETDAKVIDVALDLGYSDHAHFTRAFRRWAACSPQEFRRRCNERRRCA